LNISALSAFGDLFGSAYLRRPGEIDTIFSSPFLGGLIKRTAHNRMIDSPKINPLCAPFKNGEQFETTCPFLSRTRSLRFCHHPVEMGGVYEESDKSA
jgi:hypothetical protein